MRSARVSTWPNIIVAVERRPWRCASSITASHSSAEHLLRGELSAHAVDEDLGAAARHRVETRGAQARAAPRTAARRETRQMCTISGGESACSHRSGNVAFSRRNSVLVVLDAQLRVVPALQQDLLAAERVRLADLALDLLDRQHVAFFVVRRPVERAERAERVAHVRVVDVAVDDVGHDPVRVLAPPDQVGQRAERRQPLVLEQHERVRGGDAAPAEHGVGDGVERLALAGQASLIRSSPSSSAGSRLVATGPAREREAHLRERARRCRAGRRPRGSGVERLAARPRRAGRGCAGSGSAARAQDRAGRARRTRRRCASSARVPARRDACRIP